MKRSKQSHRKQLHSLNDDETAWFGTLRSVGNTFGRLVKVALLLGQRRGKLGSNDEAAMKWSDIEDGVWVINVEDEKGTNFPPSGCRWCGRSSSVSLATDMRPGVGGRGPYNSFSQGINELRDVSRPTCRTGPCTILRRTARKLMTRANIRPDAAEIAIGHSIKGIRGHDDVREYQPMIDHAFECVARSTKRFRILRLRMLFLRK